MAYPIKPKEPNYCISCVGLAKSDPHDRDTWKCELRTYDVVDYITGLTKTVTPLCICVRGTEYPHCLHFQRRQDDHR